MRSSQIEIFDTGIALISGLMIVPAVYLFSGGDESAMQAGSGLMFITLPKVFAGMPFGTAIGRDLFPSGIVCRFDLFDFPDGDSRLHHSGQNQPVAP